MALSSVLVAKAVSLGHSFVSPGHSLLRLGVICLTVALIYLVVTYLRLRHVPGPLLAAISNVPRWGWVRSYRAHDVHIALHRRYGRLVRLGPNMVSVADAAEIPHIYSFAGKFPKVCSLRDRRALKNARSLYRIGYS